MNILHLSTLSISMSCVCRLFSTLIAVYYRKNCLMTQSHRAKPFQHVTKMLVYIKCNLKLFFKIFENGHYFCTIFRSGLGLDLDCFWSRSRTLGLEICRYRSRSRSRKNDQVFISVLVSTFVVTTASMISTNPKSGAITSLQLTLSFFFLFLIELILKKFYI